MTARRILMITRHYLDDNNGGANASKGFIHAFAQVFGEIDLIYPEHDGTDCSSYVPSACRLYPCFDRRSRLMKGIDIYRGRLHRFTDFVRKHLADNRYEIIVIDHSVTVASLVNVIIRSGSRIITIHHNVERDYIKDNEPSIVYRLPYDYFAMKAERDALRLSNVNLTLTEKDAIEFRTWYDDSHIYNIGICEYRALPDANFVEKAADHVFVISGSLCFKQSLQPIIDFVTTYYPLLRRECPDARLIIAGRNPSAELYDLCRDDKSIEIIANPDNMPDVISRADYYICPIDGGSGIKLRIMDGLKNGLPILCHRNAAAGYESFVEKDILFTYNDREDFVQSLRRLLGSTLDRNYVYDAFRQEFSVSTLASRLRDILKKENLI